MDLVLYRNFSVWNKLDKSLTETHRVSDVQLVESINDKDISILSAIDDFRISPTSVNYMALTGGSSDGFYFIDSIDRLERGLQRINGHMDLLMTYKDQIKTLRVAVERSTLYTSGRVDDPLRTYSADARRGVVPFPNPIPDDEASGCFVITTSQKGYDSTPPEARAAAAAETEK